jgi:hypothetical protein
MIAHLSDDRAVRGDDGGSRPARLVAGHHHVGGRGRLAEETPMSSDRFDGLEGLTVRVRDGRTLGVVVGVFAEGLLAGRLRVQGAYVSLGHKGAPQDGIAVYAIPRQAVVHRLRATLVVDTTLAAARARWLMHVRQR